MALRHDLQINQGETWSFTWTKRDADGSAVDLTGYGARMAFRDRVGGALQAYLSTDADADGGSISLGGALGTVTLAMTAQQSAALASELASLSVLIERPATDREACYVYDLELISGGGVVTRELEGRVIVRREITT